MNIQRFAALLAALLCLSACTGENGPLRLEMDGVEISEGATVDLRIGEFVDIYAYFESDGGAEPHRLVGWKSEDESVAATRAGGLLGVHGGETTATAFVEGTERTVTLKVRVPVVPHGDIYVFCEADEDGREAYYSNGKRVEEPFNLLAQDASGNLFRGHLSGALSLQLNGKAVLEGYSLPGRLSVCKAKGGRLYLVSNEDDRRSHWCIISEAGVVREGTIDTTVNEWEYPYGAVNAMDEDAEGNLVFWGRIRKEFVTYAHLWELALDGTLTCEVPRRPDWDLMPVAEDAWIDANGDRILLAHNFDLRYFEVWKNQTMLYRPTENAEITNWGRRGKMLLRGTDVWFACCEITRQGEEWWDVTSALNIYRNGQKQFTALTREEFLGGMDFCITPSGDVYTVVIANGALVCKNDTPVLCIPDPNLVNPSIAVRD